MYSSLLSYLLKRSSATSNKPRKRGKKSERSRLWISYADAMLLMPEQTLSKAQQTSAHAMFLVLLRETEGLVAAVEDGKVLLEQHVAEDLQTLATVALDAAEAGVVADASERDVLARDGGDEAAVADLHTEVRHVGVARVDVTAGSRGYLRALDLLVKSLRNVVVDQEQGRASVGNSGAGTRVLNGLAADAVGRGIELPEALAGVDRGEVNVARVLAGVDASELVGSGGVVLKVGSEERLVQVVHDAVEEGLLRLRLHGVDAAEGETEETVVVLVGDKGAGELGGELDSLSGGSSTADVDIVEADGTGSTAAVAVLDLPGALRVFLPGGALARVKCSVLALLGRWQV